MLAIITLLQGIELRFNTYVDIFASVLENMHAVLHLISRHFIFVFVLAVAVSLQTW